jgi:hypothetical protein
MKSAYKQNELWKKTQVYKTEQEKKNLQNDEQV